MRTAEMIGMALLVTAVWLRVIWRPWWCVATCMVALWVLNK